jgi:hypothetical protein
VLAGETDGDVDESLAVAAGDDGRVVPGGDGGHRPADRRAGDARSAFLYLVEVVLHEHVGVVVRRGHPCDLLF